jgi:parallel beta helix pectate lyase-like protein
MKTKSRISAACAIAALLLSASDTPAATITVTNGNDIGPGSLRHAILSASSGDTINFAPCLTTVTLTSGELVIDKNLTLTGPGANRLTVHRSTDALDFRIFHITSSTAIVFISGLTISNGSVSELEGDGGGIRSAGVLTLSDSTISANQAAGTEEVGGSGGGVLNESGTMTITRCTVSNNSARYRMGSSGDSGSANGGGIMNYSGGSVIITNCTISGNLCFFEPSIFFSDFPHGAGGGVDNAGFMTITNCTVSGNSVSGTGFGTLYGGGISNYGDLQITSSTIAFNSASGESGGFGGGVYGVSGPTRTDSSIIALNRAPTGPDVAGGLQSMGYNIIGNNADAIISSQPTDQIGTPAAPIDPLLGPPADNGGPTLTHALQAGSPAINRGDPAAPPQDQRGYGRAGVPDVGAFGYGGVGPTTLGNVSTRAFVQTGDNVVIGGFIVHGAGPKRVIIRAIGPWLTQYGVPNVLADPTLELHNCTGTLIASNDNWQHTIFGGIITRGQVVDIQNSGYAPGDTRESAIIADLPAGNYTAIVRGVTNTTGVALAEVYDLSPETNSILGNISTRSFVQMGDNVMIGGFIVQGTQPKRVIIRAIGPELTQYGVPDALANPTLELHNAAGTLIASNDNWMSTIIGGIITSNQGVEIRDSGYAPADGRESAIIATLPLGNYTAIVRGVNNTTGVALVEVYDLH